MRIILLILITFKFTLAQITITHNDLISVGDVIEQVDDVSPNSLINVGNAGANQFWDFSSLQILGSYTQECILPSSTPYSGSHPNANLCMFDGIEYVFLNKTSSKIELLGIDDSVFTNPVVVLPLPLNYGASIVDGPVVFVDSSISGPFVDFILTTYGYSASLISGFAAHTSDTISIRGEIETEFTVDAYGSMKLPMGIYDCLRLKIKRNSTTNIQVHCIDTITGAGTGWYQIPFVDFDEEVSYQWWTNNSDSRFFLAEAYVDSNENVTDVTFTNNSTQSQEGQIETKFLINKIGDYILLRSSTSNFVSSFSIRDITGKLIFEDTFFDELSISTKSFESGIYIINIYENGIIKQTKKIVK